jgi:hypothetical protein
MYDATWLTHRRSDGKRFMSTISRHQLSHSNILAFSRSTLIDAYLNTETLQTLIAAGGKRTASRA